LLAIFGSPVVENSHTGSIPVSLGLFPIFAGNFIEVIVFGSRENLVLVVSPQNIVIFRLIIQLARK